MCCLAADGSKSNIIAPKQVVFGCMVFICARGCFLFEVASPKNRGLAEKTNRLIDKILTIYLMSDWRETVSSRFSFSHMWFLFWEDSVASELRRYLVPCCRMESKAAESAA